jgi:hypothetical protein
VLFCICSLKVRLLAIIVDSQCIILREQWSYENGTAEYKATRT